MDDALLGRAIRNNADWCDIVCRAHGVPGEFAHGMWINRERVPRFYPNVQTLTAPGARQVALIRELIVQLPSAWAVKDSFASLDLVPLGFTRLFEAQWIVLPRQRLATFDATSAEAEWKVVRSEDSLSAWEHAWRHANGDTNPARIFLPPLLDNPDVTMVAACRGKNIVAGAIGNRNAGVIGWSNFFAGAGENPSANALGSLALISQTFPDAEIVGYEEGEMLRLVQSLGFETLAPLRVWLFTG